MPIVIEEFIVDTPPPEAASTDPARGDGDASQAVTAWTAGFAHRLEAELALAAERAARLHAD